MSEEYAFETRLQSYTNGAHVEWASTEGCQYNNATMTAAAAVLWYMYK